MLSGNVIIIISTTITVVALTWAGVTHPWGSYQVLVPLILGLLGTAVFFWYEAKFATEPVVPWTLMNNRTGFLGYVFDCVGLVLILTKLAFSYVTVFIHGLVSTTVICTSHLYHWTRSKKLIEFSDYLPVYFQGSLMQGPVKSGISLFGNAFTIAPGAISTFSITFANNNSLTTFLVCGIAVTNLKIYKPQNFIGWALTAIGIGLLSLLKRDTPKGQWVGFQIIEGFGLGILYASPTFPVLAPLPVTETAHALALFTFVRSYSQTWGVQVGATILQNQLTKKLPTDFLQQLGGSAGGELAYAVIPTVPSLPEPMRSLVQAAFADSLRTIWYVMTAFSVFGFLLVLGMKELPMHEVTDDEWGMKQKEAAPDPEKQ